VSAVQIWQPRPSLTHSSYVGTLHEISSETATVALENVRSYGTEGRLQNPDDEIAASDTVYEYIKFRGSDVKDLRIEEAPAAKENKPPQQMPNDPAILGVSRFLSPSFDPTAPE
jgi:protein LSM14